MVATPAGMKPLFLLEDVVVLKYKLDSGHGLFYFTFVSRKDHLHGHGGSTSRYETIIFSSNSLELKLIVNLLYITCFLAKTYYSQLPSQHYFHYLTLIYMSVCL
jgi:hypothetical protein